MSFVEQIAGRITASVDVPVTMDFEGGYSEDDGKLAAPLVQAVQGKSVIPQSFVISRDGRIVKHFSGFSPYSTPQLMRQAIEDALNDKSKA